MRCMWMERRKGLVAGAPCELWWLWVLCLWWWRVSDMTVVWWVLVVAGGWVAEEEKERVENEINKSYAVFLLFSLTVRSAL